VSVTVGATLATLTLTVEVLLSRVALPAASSASCTLTLTEAEAAPSGKVTWKLPPVAVVVSEPATSVPLVTAMSLALTVKASWPGSLTVKV
jgi:hypothetical protein